MLRREVVNEVIDGKDYWFASDMPEVKREPVLAYLLPAYDEYFIG